MVNTARTVAKDLARARKRTAKKPPRTIGVSGGAYAVLRKAARQEGVPITALASAAIYEGIDEAARVIREEMEAAT